MEEPDEHYDELDFCDRCRKVELIANWSGICYKCQGVVPPKDDPFSEDVIDPAQVDAVVIDYDAHHRNKTSKKEPAPVKKPQRVENKEPKATAIPEQRTCPPMIPMSLRSAASYIVHNYGRKLNFLNYELMIEEVHKALLEHNWSDEVKTSGDMWDDSNSHPPPRGPLIARVWKILHFWDEGKYEEWTDDGMFAERMIKIIIWYVVLFRMATYVEP